MIRRAIAILFGLLAVLVVGAFAAGLLIELPGEELRRIDRLDRPYSSAA